MGSISTLNIRNYGLFGNFPGIGDLQSASTSSRLLRNFCSKNSVGLVSPYHILRGAPMKTPYRIFLMFLYACFALAAAQAQSSKKETIEADNHESLGQRIGSMVENVIDKLEREFSGRIGDASLRQNG